MALWLAVTQPMVFGPRLIILNKTPMASRMMEQLLIQPSLLLHLRIVLGLWRVQVSVGVITKVLENVAFLRAQNGGTASRLAFNAESLVTRKQICVQPLAGWSMSISPRKQPTWPSTPSCLRPPQGILAQANANTEIALMLLR